jgi:serine/threonine-protein kinase PpkA
MTETPRRDAFAIGAALLGAAVGVRSAQAQPTPARPGGAPAPAGAPRLPETLQDAPSLYRRVIIRPGSSISNQPGVLGRPAQGFSVFYVYGRRTVPDGVWLEVGPALDGRTVGWLPEARTIAWRHNMVLSFNNPSGRERAMFFRDGETPRGLWMSTATRAAESQRLRAEAMAGRDGPVIALEPETHVNITDQFYLLPVLNATPLQNERGQSALQLEVISAPLTPPAPQRPTDDEAFRNFRGALVFVIDTTISMGPYIDRTREAIRQVIERIRGTEVGDRFRFGMVAYRDDLGGNPRLEYVTRLISQPDLNEPPDAILARLPAVQEAQASNDGFDEDGVAGLKMALDDINWEPFGGRFVVLVTDAGTRDANDPRSTTGHSVENIRALAQHPQRRVTMSAVHLRTPEGQANHRRAERQWRELTETGTPAGQLYFPVRNGDVAEFGRVVDALARGIIDQVSVIIGRPVGQPPQGETEAERRAREQMAAVGQAMRLSYLGEARRQTVPDVVRSFVLDQDLADPTPARRPLEVRVLLTSGQLSDMATTLRNIVEAANADRLSAAQFFERLRAAMGATIADPRRVPQSQTAELGSVFGEFLRGLPYQSPFMEITFDEWRNMSHGRRREVTNRLESLLRLYAEYNRERRFWTQLDGNTNPNEAVFPVPLDNLP